MPSSALGAAAAAYAARADRPRRVTRLSANLTALAAIGEPSPATSHKERPPSPKRWTRETPGGVDEDGTIHRPGSPLRLSSSYLDQAGSRQFMRKVSGARYTNALLYGYHMLLAVRITRADVSNQVASASTVCRCLPNGVVAYAAAVGIA